ncbi:MAG: purine-nucleoside phosphorylase, partial [Anaerolineae bacterium]|nr:purine-nucleoside phosphorylase [Anaerolineae bacterium]
LMLLKDHINLPGLAGLHPLIGPNDEQVGPRFPGMAQTYDRHLRETARSVALMNKIPLREGVYLAVAGPSFETPAEIRMLRGWGAQAVGMSTVHEVIVARHAGMRVLAISSITNVAIDANDTTLETNHEEVLETGKLVVPRLMALLRGVLRALPA